jgi:hypothetical protein
VADDAFAHNGLLRFGVESRSAFPAGTALRRT